MRKLNCECADPGCLHHMGTAACHTPVGRTRILYRVDMEDETGTRMCAPCREDALESGLFSEEH